ncbi:MAG: C4-dicarboxylate TRAP transporter substrate-binding protein [Hyphomicrobiales bacterium]|nr:C4-dicarboxylate TRAP transporter substrate-binding protein [Hyphomicrobiales bacterium]
MKKWMISTVAVLLTGSFVAPALAESWDVSLWGKRRAFTEHVERLAELVSEKTNGEFTLNLSYGGLSKNKENLDGIEAGAFEMAQFCAGYHRDKNPTITVMELPFLGVDNLEAEIAASMAVYNHPAAKQDLGRWNATLLMPSPLPQYNIAGKGKAPTSLADLKGINIRATGGIGNALAKVGINPVSLGAGEVYGAMESGAISGAAFAPHAHLSYKVVDEAEWWTSNLNPGSVNCPVVVNSEALADLSDAHREALLGSVDESLEWYLDKYQVSVEKFNDKVAENNVRVLTFSDADVAALKATAQPVLDEWIADMNSRGLPGQELYDLVQSTLAAQ